MATKSIISIKIQILKKAEIVRKSRTMILFIKMSSLWTVSNPNEFIFPHEVIVFSQHMGTKHPLTKEAEPVDYFSQLSTTNTDCLIDIIVRETNMYARQHLSLESKSGGDLRIQIKIYNYWSSITNLLRFFFSIIVDKQDTTVIKISGKYHCKCGHNKYGRYNVTSDR